MKTSTIFTICFFFVVHTQDVWSHHVGLLIIFLYIFLFAAFLFLVGAFLNELVFSIREKFQSRNRNTALIITAFVFAITLWKPFGIVKYDMFSSEKVLVTYAEGAANCTTSMNLKKDGTFSETIYCFGIERKSGVYRIKNDTIWFKSNDDFYEFAIIGPNKFNSSGKFLNMYKTKQDTIPYAVEIQN